MARDISDEYSEELERIRVFADEQFEKLVGAHRDHDCLTRGENACWAFMYNWLENMAKNLANQGIAVTLLAGMLAEHTARDF